MRALLLIAVVLALTAAPRVALSSHLWAYAVYQPTETENGIVVSPVTFLVQGDDFSPGREVEFVCRPYLLPITGPAINAGDLVNANAAARAHIKTRRLDNPAAPNTYLFGDTLRVTVDLTEAWPVGMSAEVVDATVRAVLQTAALSCGRGKGKAGHVDLRIEGAPEYAAAARTYSCEEAARGGRSN